MATDEKQPIPVSGVGEEYRYIPIWEFVRDPDNKFIIPELQMYFKEDCIENFLHIIPVGSDLAMKGVAFSGLLKVPFYAGGRVTYNYIPATLETVGPVHIVKGQLFDTQMANYRKGMN